MKGKGWIAFLLALLICASLLPQGVLADQTLMNLLGAAVAEVESAEAESAEDVPPEEVPVEEEQGEPQPDGAAPAEAPGSNLSTVTFTGSYSQTEARGMLGRINDFRTGEDAWYWNSDDETRTQFNTEGESALAPLIYDYALEQIAMERAAEIAVYMGHTRPDGSSCFTAEYEGVKSSGENIAWGSTTEEAVFLSWRADGENFAGQGDRRNMLGEDYTAVGIACFVFEGTKCWVQEFGFTGSGMEETPARDGTAQVTVAYSPQVVPNWKGFSSMVSFDPNGGTVTAAPLNVYYGYAYGFFDDVFPTPVWSGHTFLGWYTEASGGEEMTEEDQVTILGDHTLYALWSADSYTVSYDANGGEGAPAAQEESIGTALTLSETVPARAGYSFQGWAVSADGKAIYAPGGEYAEGASVTLYAVWVQGIAAPMWRFAEITDVGVRLSWNASQGAARYAVFRQLPSGAWSKIGATNETTYMDTAVESGTTYTYAVCCVSEDGREEVSDWSEERSIRFGPVSAPVLDEPEMTAAGVKLTWAPVEGVVRYAVYRQTDEGAWRKLGATNDLYYTDTTAAEGTTYTYALRCVTSDGVTELSDLSESLTVTYSSITPPVLTSVTGTNAGVRIAWDKVDGVSRYSVYCKLDSGAWRKVGATKGTTLVDASAAAGTTCTYAVVCVSEDGQTELSGYSKEMSILYLDAPVLNSADSTAEGVRLSWSAVPGAVRYAVYYRLSTGAWHKVGATEGTTFTDSSAAEDGTYIYAVRCVSADGLTELSGISNTKNIK